MTGCILYYKKWIKRKIDFNEYRWVFHFSLSFFIFEYIRSFEHIQFNWYTLNVSHPREISLKKIIYLIYIHYYHFYSQSKTRFGYLKQKFPFAQRTLSFWLCSSLKNKCKIIVMVCAEFFFYLLSLLFRTCILHA